MRNARTILLILPLLLSAASCETTSAYKHWSALYDIPTGSKVTLNKELIVPSRNTQTFIQDGEQSFHRNISSGYNQYEPFCYFEVSDVMDQVQHIEPDTFTVTRVTRDQTEIVFLEPVQVAWLGNGRYSDDASDIVQLRIMYLESPMQPNVRKLVCAGGFAHPAVARLPTVEEIRHALGNVAKLEVPG